MKRIAIYLTCALLGGTFASLSSIEPSVPSHCPTNTMSGKVRENVKSSGGVVVLDSGTAIVNNPIVTQRSRIFLTRLSANSSKALGELIVSSINEGSSFTIKSVRFENPSSSQLKDVSVVNWLLIDSD